MARKTALDMDQRTYVDELIATVIAADGAEGTNKTSGAVRVIGILEQRASRGERVAEGCLDALALDGAVERVGEFLKGQEVRVSVGYTGEVTVIPARIGVRPRNENGLPHSEYQQKLFILATWDELERYISQQAVLRDGLSQKVRALVEVLRLRERFPAAQTPLDACRMAGLDWQDLAL